MSARFNPAARTRTRTRSAAALGASATLRTSRPSTPPKETIVTAFMMRRRLIQELARATEHVLHIESQIVHRYVAGRGSAETIEANHIALRTDVTIPSLANAGFDCEACADRRRENFIGIVLRLFFEQFGAMHPNYAGRDAVLL